MGKVKKVTGIDVAAPVRAVQQGIASIGNATGISPALTQVFQPVEKAIVQPVGKGLASFDKAVGNTIPGGWGTVASIAGSAMGVPTPYLVGLGALNGSGVTRKGGSFNLQGALIGGATAYASAELGDYLRGAAPPTVDPVTGALTNSIPPVDIGSSISNSGINAATGEIGSGLVGNSSSLLMDPSLLTSGNTAALNSLSAPLEAGFGAGLQVAPPPSIASQIMSGNFGDALSQAGTNISQGATNIGNYVSNIPGNIADSAMSAYDTAGKFVDSATNPSTYSNALDTGMSNASQTGSGIKNLMGLGEGTAKAAAAQAATTGIKALPMVGLAAYGTMSLADLDAQRNYLKDQLAAGNVAQAEYDSAMAEINRSEGIARKAVADNPFNSNPDRSPSIGGTDLTDQSNTVYARNKDNETLYGFNPYSSNTLYAKGGEVKGYFMGGLSGIFEAIKASKEGSNGGMAAGTPVGFQNLKSEGMPGEGFGSSVEGILKAIGGRSNFASPPLHLGNTLYGKRPGNENIYERFVRGNYAVGGSVDDEPGMDDVRGLSPGNLSNGFMGNRVPSYAAGGMPPRFLSGGGDGMSDSIPANIGGKQEARLADGEFVIPADVVSHLGNGSSKAGAKQLYSMMDKVRKARTGNPKQGKQINPRKYLAA